MTDSLEGNDGPFAGVRLKSLQVLIRLVGESAIRDVQYIRRRFLEVAPRFGVTLRLLSALGCIVTRDGLLSLHVKVAKNSHDDKQLSDELLERLGARPSSARRELFRFLEKFQVVDGRVIYCPFADQRSVESDLRNLLVEMAVITHDPETGAYVLSPEHHPLLVNAVRGRRPVSPSLIEREREESMAVAEAVERAIIRYEQLRVGEQYAHHVQYVALTDAAAGYDVQSVTVDSRETITPRLIEVKAVPSGTLRFYWTANEVTTARRFGSWYFLYLVPVRSDGQPDINALQVINDPYGVVLGAQVSWAVVPELFKCELAVSTSHGSDLHYG